MYNHIRITPAHAGKRGMDGAREGFGEDHPRPCGEKKLCRCRVGRRQGSPPPMRGKGSLSDSTVSLDRITPAHAGKSYRYSFYSAHV